MSPGQCFHSHQLGVCFVSLIISSTRFVSANLQSRQSLRGALSTLVQLEMTVPWAQGLSLESPDRTGTKRPSVPCLLGCETRVHFPALTLRNALCSCTYTGHCLTELWVDRKGEENLSGAFSSFYQQRDVRAFLRLQSLAMM